MKPRPKGRTFALCCRQPLFIEMLEAFIVILTPLFFMPLMTAFMAYNHGRSFWRWFAVGCGLPYVSLFVIMFVVHHDRKKLA